MKILTYFFPGFQREYYLKQWKELNWRVFKKIYEPFLLYGDYQGLELISFDFVGPKTSTRNQMFSEAAQDKD